MTPQYQPGLHRFAVLTALISMLPITVGALVTTMGAGMAFLDWPTSDSQNMLLYPWFQSLRTDPDKFVEHGHRLGGVVIGLVSIVLARVFWLYESRAWARWLGFVVLVLVCGQGLLGGLRVRLNSPELAMFHGVFASWVFAFLGCLAAMTSRAWFQVAESNGDCWNLSTGISGILAMVSILLQYVLGGLLRHLGMVVHEHMGMAFVVFVFVMWSWFASSSSGNDWLRRSAAWMALAVVAQIMLGLATFVAKFGHGLGDSVVIQNSLFQILSRTSHTIMAMLVWMLAVVHVVKVCRVFWIRNFADCRQGQYHPLPGASLQTGGAR